MKIKNKTRLRKAIKKADMIEHLYVFPNGDCFNYGSGWFLTEKGEKLKRELEGK